MAQQTLNNGESANIFRTKLNSNFDDLFANKAPLNHASAGSTYGLASTTMFGHIKITANNGLSISDGVLSLTKASTSQIGAVQLVNNATSTDTDKAVTPAALKSVADSVIQTYTGTTDPSSSLGKNGDIYGKLI